jgi:hypothetical protein
MHNKTFSQRAFAAALFAVVCASAGAQTISDHIAAFADIRNGGVTADEAHDLRAEAASYALQIEFAERTSGSDTFAADVELVIVDQRGEVVLALPSADPIVLARLAPGRYTIEATYEGQTKRQQVTVGRGHQKVGFVW